MGLGVKGAMISNLHARVPNIYNGREGWEKDPIVLPTRELEEGGLRRIDWGGCDSVNAMSIERKEKRSR